MTLAGYQKSNGKRSGGVRAISIIAATDVLGVSIGTAPETCTAITTKTGKEFATYEFKDGDASFSEQMSVGSGVVRVGHELKFAIERPESASAEAIQKLAEASADGFIAIVTTNSNVSFLVGYSTKFGSEQPLRLTGTLLSSGDKHSDDTKETIKLVSQDSCKAMVYTPSTTL